MKRTKQLLMGLALAAVVMVPHLALAAGPTPVNLGTAGRFLILSGAAITSTGGGFIYGDVGASPIDGASIGLNPAQVVGTIFAVDATGPAGSVVDPGMLTTAKADLTTAYDDAAGRLPAPSGDFLNPGGGNLGGQNLIPGLYKFSSSALITGGNLTLTGGADDVWIFQISSDLQVDPGMQVILAGGAQARNIFWQVGTSATIGTSAVFKGTILADQSITMNASSTLEGRALASIAAITFNGQSVSLPASVGDFVWDDANMNGIQDGGETGHADVVVNLYDAGTNLVATTNSDVNGLYVFSGLVPGDYSLEFVQPAGSLFTLPGQGGVALGSDADVTTGFTPSFTLFAGDYDPNWDAGLVSSNAAVRVTKIADSAADGAVLYVRSGADVTYTYRVRNSGETYLTNVVVTDDVLGAIGTIPMMAPGELVVLTAVQSNLLSDVVNVALVMGTPVYPNGELIPGLDDVSGTDDADTRIDLFFQTAPQITKTVSVDPAMPGQMVSYTITVFNASSSATVSNVTVVETYDAMFHYRFSNPAPLSGTSNVWALGDLAPGFTTNIVITGRVSKKALQASGLSNTAEVFSDWGSRTVTLNSRVINERPIPVTLLYFKAVTAAGGVKTKWETATEFDNLGFNVYRSASASGARIKINAALIPGSSSSDGQRYKQLDASAKPGVTYFYWLEEVAVDFKTVTYGPAIRTGSVTDKPEATPALGTFRTATTGGLYRIRYETLAAAGLQGASLDTASLAVRIEGVSVPLFVNAEGPTMQPGDSLLFYTKASKDGLACEVAVESMPPRMELADASPVHGAGDVYTDQAGVGQRMKFITDPSIVRYLLIDFTDAPVWVLDVSQPTGVIMLAGYAYVGIENGLTAVLLSYDPGTGPAKCLAVQDSAVLDVPGILKP